MKTSLLTFRTRYCWTRSFKTRLFSHVAEQNSPTYSRRPSSFEDTGLRAPLVKAVHAAFPNVKAPTEIQSTLISNALKGKDIILQDETGSGKSFGIILALLSKPRLVFNEDLRAGKGRDVNAVTSLVLVPHRDLAFQMLHWIELIIQASSDKPPPIASIAQVLVRDAGRHLTEGLALLRKDPPHIMIATPASLVEVLQEDPNAFSLKELSTVVLDEVDYMIETLPLDSTNQKHRKRLQKIARHPGPARALLDKIYEDRLKLTTQNREGFLDAPYHSPQLILSSATIRKQLRHYFISEKQYLSREVVKIKGAELTMHSLVSHHVLVASEAGIVNIPKAVATEDEDVTRLNLDKAINEPLETFPSFSEVGSIAANRSIEFSMTPSPLNQNSLEAVAAVFALDVPSIALLVIPPRALFAEQSMTCRRWR
ncbi:P-loop containing nucleoside triphosphate hydrolase protein [Rhodocollybia butyracea]|uniref:RNA helicase n=1 Tax=Rhodocollybia butyracea TaxID=206335 RepID=A0A9P5UDF0_9AGAR|nr:P-loop containing nucleoside triphosphate hydrolase protein [Rhodocollybia butyracea]